MQILEDELAAVLYITKAAFCHGFATKRYKTILTILHDTHDIERSFHRFCTFFNDIHVIERYFTDTSKLQEIIYYFSDFSQNTALTKVGAVFSLEMNVAVQFLKTPPSYLLFAVFMV